MSVSGENSENLRWMTIWLSKYSAKQSRPHPSPPLLLLCLCEGDKLHSRDCISASVPKKSSVVWELPWDLYSKPNCTLCSVLLFSLPLEKKHSPKNFLNMKCHSVFPGITSSKTDNQMLKRLNTINSRAEFTLHSCPTLWQQSGLYLLSLDTG